MAEMFQGHFGVGSKSKCPGRTVSRTFRGRQQVKMSLKNRFKDISGSAAGQNVLEESFQRHFEVGSKSKCP
jgi:hypothetical protein